MANRNFSNSRIFTGHVMPVWLDCNFTVDSTNGAGITSLKGPYIANVFMHTSGSPAAGSPNPASGTIVVQLQDGYNYFYTSTFSNQSPNSGSSLLVASAGLTVGVAYTITILGTTSTSQWHAVGVPAGVTPAVGVSFIAAATSATGTGAVQITAAAGSAVDSIEIVGNPNLSIAPDPTQNQGFGSQFILQCRNAAGTIAAPANGSVISLSFLLSNSSVLNGGE